MMILASSTEYVFIPLDGPYGDLTGYAVSVALLPDDGTEPADSDYLPAIWLNGEVALLHQWAAGDYMAYVRISAPPEDVRLISGRVRIGDTNATSAPGGGGGTGTVTAVSVETANGFAGDVATAGTTPAITLKTTVAGLLKGDGTSLEVAEAGTDYLAPDGDGSRLAGITSGQVSGLGTAAGHAAGDFDAAGSAASVSGAITASLGADNGIATLDSAGHVPVPQLPAATTLAQGTVTLDGTVSDIQPVAPAASAGTAGLAADAGHAHKGFARVATTGIAGFTLGNSTPNVLTWTAPSDGAIHMFVVLSVVHVTSAETGGTIQVIFQSPISGAGNHFSQLLAGGLGTDAGGQTGTTIFGLVQPGSTVTVQQTTPLTAGAATAWLEIWGS